MSQSGLRPAPFPRELAKEMGSLGLFGMHLEGYGCAGTNAVSYGLACTELEAGDSGVRSFVSVQGSLAMYPIWAFGSEEQKQRWLPPMAAGDVIGCFGLTEADAGSDPGSMKTRARRDGSDWITRRNQDVDHQRRHRRRRRRVGQHRRGRSRIHRSDRHPRLLHERHPSEALATRLGHVGADPRRRPTCLPTRCFQTSTG